MVRRIVWSGNASTDRYKIFEYWFKRLGSKTYIRKLNASFNRTIRLIAKHPGIGTRYENEEVLRYFVVEYYLIYYRIHKDVIEVLHVWDSRRNPDDFTL